MTPIAVGEPDELTATVAVVVAGLRYAFDRAKARAAAWELPEWTA